MPTVRTPIGILSFPVLFSPRPRAANGEPSYHIALLFDQNAQRTPEFAAMRRAVLEEIDNKCGAGKSQDKQFMAGLRSPFRPCEEKPYKGYDIPGGVYIAPWSKMKPGLVDALRNDILVPEDIWAGQFARAEVKPFYYNNSGNRGVNFGLNHVQICRVDGERIDGRKSARETFDDYIGEGAALLAEDSPF